MDRPQLPNDATGRLQWNGENEPYLTLVEGYILTPLRSGDEENWVSELFRMKVPY